LNLKHPRVNITHRKIIPGDPVDFDEKSLAVVQVMIAEALDGLNFNSLVNGRSVLVKPNLVRPNPEYPSATTTDPRVIIAMMRHCRDHGAKSIGVGDKPGIGLSCRAGEQLLGIGDYIKETEAHFVYFDESEENWEKNPHGELEETIPVPKVLRDYEVLIDLPKLKLHMHTGVSLGIKNLFGLIPEHFRMKHHREDLHRFLVDYLYLVNPDVTLIDGIWALEGQAPICGTPVEDFNLLIASNNIVAADAVGAYLMGVDPEEITMLRMASDVGFGPIDLDRMELQGAPIRNLRRHFQRPVLSSQAVYKGIDVKVRGGCVGCMSSLRHALDRLNMAGLLKEDPQTILLGLRYQAEDIEVKEGSEHIWCYGDCCLETFLEQFESDPQALWLEGCPPHFMEFVRAYCKAKGLEL